MALPILTRTSNKPAFPEGIGSIDKESTETWYRGKRNPLKLKLV
ncbi:MAG: hypothetical protein QXK18_00980 [Candidatus Bathyarchaeia archaeon]